MNRAEYLSQGIGFHVARHFRRSHNRIRRRELWETATAFAQRKAVENADIPRHLWPHWEGAPFVWEEWMTPLAVGLALGIVANISILFRG